MDFQGMLTYSAALEQNNNRTWFHENHDWYQTAKGEYLELLEQIRFVIAENAPALANDIMPMQTKDWMYRIARDMRYYKNRPPYDPAFRAYICKDRKSWMPIGYFLRIAADSSCFGTGLWCEDTAGMNRVRDYLMEHWEEWETLLLQSGLFLSGDKLKTMPRGYDENHPAAQLIKYKNWSVVVEISDDQLTTFAEFEALTRHFVTRMEPLRLFLLRAARGETQENCRESYHP